MTPGTRPDARSLRATPLPVSERDSAESDADAMRNDPDDALTACSEPRIRCYSQAAASALPCRCPEGTSRGPTTCNCCFSASRFFGSRSAPVSAGVPRHAVNRKAEKPCSVKQAAHALLRVRVPDRLAEQLADREDGELLELPFRRDEDGVRHHHFPDRRIRQPLDGGAAEQGVRGAHVDVLRPQTLQGA